MKRCWCGKVHPRGCSLNGDMRHFVLNWKLYQFRVRESGDENQDEALSLELVASPCRQPVGIG